MGFEFVMWLSWKYLENIITGVILKSTEFKKYWPIKKNESIIPVPSVFFLYRIRMIWVLATNA